MKSSSSIFLSGPSSIEDRYREQVLSKQRGLLARPAETQFPASHQAWNDAAARIPELLRTYRLREAAQAMPLLSADASQLDDRYLTLASVFLSALAHAYSYQSAQPTLSLAAEKHPALPACIEQPWQQVTHRLGRQYVGRNYQDDFTYNWRYLGPTQEHTLDNLGTLVKYFDLPEEEIQVTTNSAIIDTHFRPALLAILDIQNALIRKEKAPLQPAFEHITESLHQVIRALKAINPCERSRSFVDPAVWGKTFVAMVASTRPSEPNGTGADTPLFHILDAFINRTQYDSPLGQQILSRQSRLLPIIAVFLEEVRKTAAPHETVMQFPDDDPCHIAYIRMRNKYDELLQVHKRKAFGFMKLIVATGRKQTNGGTKLVADSESESVSASLHRDMTASQAERASHMTPCGHSSTDLTEKCPMTALAREIHLAKQGATSKHGSGEARPITARYNLAQIAMHNDHNDAWLVISGRVYDVSQYNHPGGNKIFGNNYGMIATEDYNIAHRHDSRFIHLIEDRCIGLLAPFRNRHNLQWLDVLHKMLTLKHDLTNNFTFNRFSSGKLVQRTDVPFIVVEGFLAIFCDSLHGNLMRLQQLFSKLIPATQTGTTPRFLEPLLSSARFENFINLGEALQQFGRDTIHKASSGALPINTQTADAQMMHLFQKIVSTSCMPLLNDLIKIITDGMLEAEKLPTSPSNTQTFGSLEKRISDFINETTQYTVNRDETEMTYLKRQLHTKPCCLSEQISNLGLWLGSTRLGKAASETCRILNYASKGISQRGSF